jgi:hypothetical protein
VLEWLLDSDPAVRWQVERDLAGAPPEVWQATRSRVATEGFGARLLALQDDDGQWAGGAFFPAGFFGSAEADEPGQPWTATTWVLKDLREWGLDARALAGTAEKLAVNSRWEYEDLPYWAARSTSASTPIRSPPARGSERTSPGSSPGSRSIAWPTAAGTARPRRAIRCAPHSTRR